MTHACALVWVASSLLAANSGDVEIVVRDPDGKPVANRMMWIVEVAPFAFRAPDASKPREIKTDAEGRARIPVEVGLWRLNIRVAGVGFGGTGLFEVRERHVARPDLPRLARFARVEGKVDPALLQPGLKVVGSHSITQQPSLDDVSVPCDADGRFVFEEIIPGELHVRLVQDRRRIAVERISLSAEPGQTRRDVVFGPPQPRDPVQGRQLQETLDRLNWTKKNVEITWVEGTVRNTRGIPLENAEVMVKGVYFGGIRNYSDLRTTHTDARGRYQIRGPHSNFQDSFTVVVRFPGRAPVLAYARAPGWDDNGPRGPLDLTVPDDSAMLTVRVFNDGKPSANVPVALSEHGFVNRLWSRETGNQQTLHELFNPVERTDKDGVARFTDLYPCLYQLGVSEDGSGLNDFPIPVTEGVARAVVPAVAIAVGEKLSLTVTLHRQPDSATLQALRPDGTPPGHRGITFSFGLRETNAMASMDFDANGIGTHRFTDSGRWAVGLHFRETESPGTPPNWEPFYEGSALLPISPGYMLEVPVKLTCDPHLPGSIQARLVGLDGKPARGTILLMSASGPDQGAIDRAASIDEEGVARFMDLNSGSYRIRGSMEAYPPPYQPLGDGPLPDDASVRDQVVFPVEQVKVASGTETRVQLQPVKAGYVRGRIKPPPGAKVSDYQAVPTYDWLKLPCSSRRDVARGEYLCGPLLPGKVEIRLRRQIPSAQFQGIPHFVTVAPGKVAQLDLEEHREPAQFDRSEQAISLGMGGISTMELPQEALAGTIFHSDGKTPAFGARAVLMVPNESQPTSSAVSDAAGRLTWTGLWIMRGSSSAAPNPPGQVTTPTVVVSLPGLAGASVIPIDSKNPKPFRAVVPPPLNASGRVTLGGQAITSQNARVRVIAGHQGRGVLDGPLSVEAIVEADGSFTLRGLTPGTYRVQAARDGIWLSRSVTLRIAPDEKLADLALDIPEAGAAVTLALVGENDRPAGRRCLKLARPDGPFMDLWPEHFATGADGTLNLRGLEIGGHQFVIEGENAPRTFQVRSFSQGPARLVFTVKAKTP